jgi:hypothetical protein
VAWGSGQCGRPQRENFSLLRSVLHVMSRARLRELMVLFVVGSALTLAVFFLALFLLPDIHSIFLPAISWIFLIFRVSAARDLKKTLAEQTFVQKLTVEPGCRMSQRRDDFCS